MPRRVSITSTRTRFLGDTTSTFVTAAFPRISRQRFTSRVIERAGLKGEKFTTQRAEIIGIATYLLQRRFTDLTESNQAKVRRFGFRLDSVKQWQGLNWQAFQQDKATMDRVESTTRDLIQLIRDLQGSQAPAPASYRNSTVVRAVRDLESMLSRQRLSAPDRSRAFQSFVASIRATTQADITQARQALRYDYFTQSLRDEAEVREEMYKLFDRLLKSR